MSEDSTVSRWLHEIGLPQYAASFEKEAITLSLVAMLTNEELLELGVTPMGHRKEILRRAQTIANVVSNPETKPAAENPTAEPDGALPGLSDLLATSLDALFAAHSGRGLEMRHSVMVVSAAAEARLIREALARTGKNITQAAKLLGVSRKGMQLKMAALGFREE